MARKKSEDYSIVFEKMSLEQIALFKKSVDAVLAKDKSSDEIMENLNEQLHIMDENIKTGKPLTEGVKSYDATMIKDPLSFYRLVYSILILFTNLMSGVSQGIYNSKFAKGHTQISDASQILAKQEETTGGGPNVITSQTDSTYIPPGTDTIVKERPPTNPNVKIIGETVETVVKKSVQLMDKMMAYLLNRVVNSNAHTDWNQLTPKTNLWLVKLATEVELMTQNPGVKQALADLAEAYTTIAIDVIDATEPSIEKINNKALETIKKVGSRSVQGLASTGQALIMEGLSLIPVAGPILNFVFGFFTGMGNLLLAITPGMKAGLEGTADGITLVKKGRDVISSNMGPVNNALGNLKSLTTGAVGADAHATGLAAAENLNTAETRSGPNVSTDLTSALKGLTPTATAGDVAQAGQVAAHNLLSSATGQLASLTDQAKTRASTISNMADQAKTRASTISNMADQAKARGLAGMSGKLGSLTDQAKTRGIAGMSGKLGSLTDPAKTRGTRAGLQHGPSSGGGKNIKKVRRKTKKISHRLQKSIKRFKGGRLSRTGRLSKRR